MSTGRVMTWVGALMVIIGATLLPWQHFVLADVTVTGWQVPARGQGVLLLGLALLGVNLSGALSKRSGRYGGFSLVLAVCLAGWIVGANAARARGFELMPWEVVDLREGYLLAAWGTFALFFGSLLVLVEEPAWDPMESYLRVALLWDDTVLEEAVWREPGTVRLGHDLGSEVHLPRETESLPLFRIDRTGRHLLGLHRQIEGDLTVGGLACSASELHDVATDAVEGDRYVEILPGDWGSLHLGRARVFFQFIEPEHRLTGGLWGWLDETTGAAVAVSFALQASVVLWSLFAWEEVAIRRVDDERKSMKVASVIVDPKRIEPEVAVLDGPGDAEGGAKAAEGEAGRFGDPAELSDARPKVPRRDGPLRDRIDPKRVGLNDLLATPALGAGGPLAEIMADPSDGFGDKIALAMAGTDDVYEPGSGPGGLGPVGLGPGGGGPDGPGRLQGRWTADLGPRADRHGDTMRAPRTPKPKRKVPNPVRSGTTTEYCDRGQIATRVRRKAGAFRACYERRLQVKPGIHGKVTARWMIGLDGAVSGVGIARSSLGDAEVERCVARVIRRLRFPKPDGGMCAVQWPFVFTVDR